jgi:hypothetical protein
MRIQRFSAGTHCAYAAFLIIFIARVGAQTPPVGVSPATLNSGNLALNNTLAKKVTVTNNQAVVLNLSAPTVTGSTDFAAVSGGSCTSTLAPAKSCTYNVAFTPTGLGSRSAALWINDDASTTPQQVALTGNGVQPATTSVTGLSFSNQVIGTTSTTKTVNLTNSQMVVLNLSAPTITGEFAVAPGGSCATTLAARSSCSYLVAFTPTGAGTRLGSLSINDDASNSPQQVSLSGGGVQPVVASSSISFPSQLITTTSAAQTVNVTNNQSVSLNLSGPTTTGDFAVATGGTCGATLAPLAKCTYLVTFTPMALGVRSGSIAIHDDAANDPQTVNLTGTGGTSGLQSISVSPVSPSIPKGSTQQFTANGNLNSGGPLNLTNVVHWLSSKTGVATINATGLATGVGKGTATIKASLSTFANSTTLSVTSAALASIAVSPTAPFVQPGGTQQFTATGAFTDNTTQDLTSTATWASSNTSVANINSVGLANTLASGNTGITASSGSVNSNSAVLTVTIPALTASMTAPRYLHTATLLNNGQVLIAGGTNTFGTGGLSTVELYDPIAKTFTATGSMSTSRLYHTATLLADGSVLVAGGATDLSGTTPLASAELYDPNSGIFQLVSALNPSTGNLNEARANHQATLLPNGNVLFTGGGTDGAAELYNPVSHAFSTTGTMEIARFSHEAVLLNSGKVLIVGGRSTSTSVALSSAELYDPNAGTFAASSQSMGSARYGFGATLLDSGKVLLTGGSNGSASLNTAEIYDPVGDGFAAAAGTMQNARSGHVTALIGNGQALLAGGCGNANPCNTNSTETYDPVTGTFTVAAAMSTVRSLGTGTLLSDGTVLLAGGATNEAAVLSSADLYLPSSTTPAGLVSIAITPANPSVPLGISQHFSAIGTFSDSSTQVLQSVFWTSSNPAVASIGSTSGVAQILSTGTVTITGTLGSLNATTTMTVTAAALVSMTVTPASATIPVSATQQFNATGTYTDGSTQDITTIATWTSSIPSLASVSNSAGTQGLATGLAPGTIMISAMLSSATTNASLTVTNAPCVGPCVLTSHYNLSRNSVIGVENTLSPSTVNTSSFGRVGSIAGLNGQIYAQPLYMSGLYSVSSLGNMVLVATQRDSVYALDADTYTQIWGGSYIPAGESPLTTGPGGDLACTNINPNVGITGTPVIDPNTTFNPNPVMYLVTKSVDNSKVYHQRLHAIDVVTGAEVFGGPVEITTPAGSPVIFDALNENQRSGLVLTYDENQNPQIYIAWGAHCDQGGFRGLMMKYTVTLGVMPSTASAYFLATQGTGMAAGIWMSGGAPAVDNAVNGNLYFGTGNGTYDGITNWGQSVMKLDSNLNVADWYTPNEWECLNGIVSNPNCDDDKDLDSGGIMLFNVPGGLPELVASGKQGEMYVIYQSNLGHLDPLPLPTNYDPPPNCTTGPASPAGGPNNIAQCWPALTINAPDGSGSFFTPTFWNGNLYTVGATDSLKAFSLSNTTIGTFNTTPAIVPFPQYAYPGSSVVVSWNGVNPGTGILWTLQETGFARIPPRGAVLRAFKAVPNGATLNMIYQATVGPGAIKFTVPTIANGKVFVAGQGFDGTGREGQVYVYGLCPCN